MTNSVAIISDAIHDFGDAFSIGVSYFLNVIREEETVTFTGINDFRRWGR
ncbi:MAG: hypothetical protein ACLUDU_14120 [Butyricimonas faecihominis]